MQRNSKRYKAKNNGILVQIHAEATNPESAANISAAKGFSFAMAHRTFSIGMYVFSQETATSTTTKMKKVRIKS